MNSGDSSETSPRRAESVLEVVGQIFLGIGVLGAFAAVASMLITAIFAREHFRTALDALGWAGWCLGAATGCFWLRRYLRRKR